MYAAFNISQREIDIVWIKAELESQCVVLHKAAIITEWQGSSSSTFPHVSSVVWVLCGRYKCTIQRSVFKCLMGLLPLQILWTICQYDIKYYCNSSASTVRICMVAFKYLPSERLSLMSNCRKHPSSFFLLGLKAIYHFPLFPQLQRTVAFCTWLGNLSDGEHYEVDWNQRIISP